METLTKYREAVLTVITPSPNARFHDDAIKQELIVDKDKYVLIRTGWSENENYYLVLMHMEIRDGLIYVFENNTDHELEEELEDEGVDRKDIISAYIAPELRNVTSSKF